MANEQIVKLRQEQAHDQRLAVAVAERQQNPIPRAPGVRAPLRDAPRQPQRPIADAFELKRQRIEFLARDLVRTGQWKKVEPAVVDYRVCIELIREGYAPGVVQRELLRLGREQEYAVRTIAQAAEKARQLGKGLER